MVKVLLVTDAMQQVVDVEAADDVIDAEGLTWEREGLHAGNRVDAPGPEGDAGELPRYVPAVTA